MQCPDARSRARRERSVPGGVGRAWELAGTLAVVVALASPTPVLAGAVASDAPLSAWQRAGAAARHRLVDTLVQRLQASAAARPDGAVPYDEVIRCVDASGMPDRLQVRGRVVTVTVGMAVALCLKMRVPELRRARYRLHERPADRP